MGPLDEEGPQQGPLNHEDEIAVHPTQKPAERRSLWYEPKGSDDPDQKTDGDDQPQQYPSDCKKRKPNAGARRL